MLSAVKALTSPQNNFAILFLGTLYDFRSNVTTGNREWFHFSTKWSARDFSPLTEAASNQLSRRLTLLDDEVACLNEAVSSWRILDCSFFNSRIVLQWCATCSVRGSVLGLIFRANPTDMTNTLEEFCSLWDNLLPGSRL